MWGVAMNKNSKKYKKYKRLTVVYIIISLILIASITFNIILLNSKNKEYIVDENIVFFGDSITKKYNTDEFYPDHNVVNNGISGNKTLDLLERIENDVYKFNPSKVFLLIGINDLNHDVSEKEILNNIQKIVNGIKANRKYSKIYIESVYPINRDSLNENEYEFNDEITNERLKKFNDRLETLCYENGITYIDVFSELIDENGNLKENYTIEGLHLNDLGYFKVTNVLDKYIKQK